MGRLCGTAGNPVGLRCATPGDPGAWRAGGGARHARTCTAGGNTGHQHGRVKPPDVDPVGEEAEGDRPRGEGQPEDTAGDEWGAAGPDEQAERGQEDHQHVPVDQAIRHHDRGQTDQQCVPGPDRRAGTQLEVDHHGADEAGEKSDRANLEEDLGRRQLLLEGRLG